MTQKENQGSYYYDLFKFFSEQHNLTLLDSEIQDILQAVDEFREKKQEEDYYEAHQDLELEDDDFAIDDKDCQFCGLSDGHMRGCPDDTNPYHELLDRGYD